MMLFGLFCRHLYNFCVLNQLRCIFEMAPGTNLLKEWVIGIIDSTSHKDVCKVLSKEIDLMQVCRTLYKLYIDIYSMVTKKQFVE